MNVVGVALLASLLQAQEAPAARSPWDGFAPGSYAVTTESIGNGAIYSLSKQVLRPRTPAGRRSFQLFSWADGRDPEESRADGEPVFKPLGSGLLEVSRRKETISIKNQKFDCDVVAYSEKADDRTGIKQLVVWTSRKMSLPTTWILVANTRYEVGAEVVRIESVQQSGDHLVNTTLEVLDLHRKRTVRGVDVDCVELLIGSLTTSPTRPGVVRSRHEWLSPQVPGGLVRSERECGTTLNSGTTTTELVEFKAIR